MARKVLVALAVVVFAAATAFAQEGGVGAGRIEIGAFPGGGMFFTKTSNGNEPAFGNYALGGSFTVNAIVLSGSKGKAAARLAFASPSTSAIRHTRINGRPAPGCIRVTSS